MRKAKKDRRAGRGRRRTRKVKPGALNLSAPVTESKLYTMKIGDFYRPVLQDSALIERSLVRYFTGIDRRLLGEQHGARDAV